MELCLVHASPIGKSHMETIEHHVPRLKRQTETDGGSELKAKKNRNVKQTRISALRIKQIFHGIFICFRCATRFATSHGTINETYGIPLMQPCLVSDHIPHPYPRIHSHVIHKR